MVELQNVDDSKIVAKEVKAPCKQHNHIVKDIGTPYDKTILKEYQKTQD